MFDDDNLVSCAGLVPVMTLAAQTGLVEMLAEKVHIAETRIKSGAANPAPKLATLIAGMCAGADSIDDADVVRSGGMKTMFGGVYAPSTIGTLLREFSFGHARQLESVLRHHLAALCDRVDLLAGGDERVFIDIDSLLRPVYGHAKQGASYGHTKIAGKQVLRKGLSPLAATISTDTAAPVIAGMRLRAGKSGSGKGAARMVAQAIATARAAGVTGQILVRGDSAYGSAAVVAACRRAGARFSLVLTKNTSVAAAIAAIPEHAWTPVQYPGAVRDPDTGAWISDAEVAEIPYTAFASTRQPVQLLMQAALEAEVTEFLGRERYQRAAACLDANEGSRNGYRSVTVKTTTGPVTLERPKLRGTTAAFASRLFGKHVTNTNALETLVIAAFVRGLSVRDVEALAEALGDQAAISKSTVSEVCKAIRAEYQAWARRRLDEIVLDYLFLDASFFRMHPGSPAEPVFGRLGHHHRGQARVRRVVTWDRRVDRCVGRFPDRSARARPWHSAAGRL